MTTNLLTRIGAAITLAVVIILGSGTPAAALSTIYPNPAPGSPGIRNSQLPSCASISGTKANEMAGQGWIGDRVLPTASGLRNGAAYLMLPCWTPGSTSGPQVFSRIWVLNDSGAYIAVTNQVQFTFIKYWCNGQELIDTGVPFGYSGGIPNGTLATWVGGANNAPTFCKTADSVITKIQINWLTNSDSLGSIIGTATWTPGAWTDGTPVTKPTSLGSIPMPNGGETKVVCPYTINTASVLDAIGSFFVTFGPWWICLFTPVGWDRSQQIPAAFELSGLSRTDDIINLVVPSAGHIFCGDVSTGTAFSMTITINTCSAVATVPTWAKIGVSLVTLLSLLYIIIRRIQWTVTP